VRLTCRDLRLYGSTIRLARLIDLHTPDLPIWKKPQISSWLGVREEEERLTGLGHRHPIRPNEVNTCRCAGSLCAALLLPGNSGRAPDAFCPITTARASDRLFLICNVAQANVSHSPQGRVKDRMMITEVLEWITSARRPVRHRLSPALRLRGPRSDVTRDRVWLEEVDRDAVRIPFHCIHAAPVCVERRPEALKVRRAHAAALVTRRRRRTILAADELARHAQHLRIRGGEGAAWVGMDCRLISNVVRYTFHDIDLAASRPIRTVRPERGYRQTSSSVNVCSGKHAEITDAMYHTQLACARRP
jgi:hypothetical protein